MGNLRQILVTQWEGTTNFDEFFDVSPNGRGAQNFVSHRMDRKSMARNIWERIEAMYLKDLPEMVASAVPLMIQTELMLITMIAMIGLEPRFFPVNKFTLHKKTQSISLSYSEKLPYLLSKLPFPDTVKLSIASIRSGCRHLNSGRHSTLDKCRTNFGAEIIQLKALTECQDCHDWLRLPSHARSWFS